VDDPIDAWRRQQSLLDDGQLFRQGRLADDQALDFHCQQNRHGDQQRADAQRRNAVERPPALRDLQAASSEQ
jgi:hypothetical protein